MCIRDRTYTLEFFNQPKGNLIINKLDSVTKAPLEGVEFEPVSYTHLPRIFRQLGE